MAKPTVTETVAALDDLVAANDKLRAFSRFLDQHAVEGDREYRLLCCDLRNQVARLTVEIEGLMRKAEELVEDKVHA